MQITKKIITCNLLPIPLFTVQGEGERERGREIGKERERERTKERERGGERERERERPEKITSGKRFRKQALPSLALPADNGLQVENENRNESS